MNEIKKVFPEFGTKLFARILNESSYIRKKLKASTSGNSAIIKLNEEQYEIRNLQEH